MAEDAFYFVFSEDERIAFTCAFQPKPIVFREYEEKFDKIYLLFIDDKWFEIVFDFLDGTHALSGGKIHYKYTERLRDNVLLDDRTDKKEIVYLVEKLYMANYIIIPRNKETYELNLIYEGEEYLWKSWVE